MSKYNLTFTTLRTANALRLPQFKNAKGQPAHSKPDGSDWSLPEWSNAALGELGEAANITKKLRRGDYTLDDRPPEFEGLTVREVLAKELADVVIYTDLLAMQIGVSLGDAIGDKFNEVSKRVGSTIRIGETVMRFRQYVSYEMVPALAVLDDGVVKEAPSGETETMRNSAEEDGGEHKRMLV